MEKKIFIVLFAVVFYNGVAYSSPVDGKQISDAKPSEEKQQPTADHINKKIEPAAVPSAQPALVSQNSSTLAPSNVSTGKNEAVHPAALNTTTSIPPLVSVNNVTQNATQVVVDNKNMNQTTAGKNSSMPVVDNKNSSQPAAHASFPTPTDPTPTEPAVSDMPRPIISGNSTNVSPTTASPFNKNDNRTTTKASITTRLAEPTPSTTAKGTIVIENKVPAPAEEKHFDGPSFIGGIVLTIGLTAIGFIAFKYYKSGKIDMNYRTL